MHMCGLRQRIATCRKQTHTPTLVHTVPLPAHAPHPHRHCFSSKHCHSGTYVWVQTAHRDMSQANAHPNPGWTVPCLAWLCPLRAQLTAKQICNTRTITLKGRGLTRSKHIPPNRRCQIRHTQPCRQTYVKGQTIKHTASQFRWRKLTTRKATSNASSRPFLAAVHAPPLGQVAAPRARSSCVSSTVKAAWHLQPRSSTSPVSMAATLALSPGSPKADSCCSNLRSHEQTAHKDKRVRQAEERRR